MPAWIHSAPESHTEDGQRECSRAARCTDPRIESVNGRTARLPALTPRAFCDADRNVIERYIREFPALSVRVHAEIGNHGRIAGPLVSTSKTPPVPINLTVDELLRDLATVLISWHERVADVARLADPDGNTGTACAVLAAHVDALLALTEEPMTRSMWLRDAAALPPGTAGLVHIGAGYADAIRPLSGADAGLEVISLHYRCRRLLGETTIGARRLAGVMCRCGYTELREILDDDGVFNGAKCGECGDAYTRETYRDLVRERERAVTASGAHRGRSVRPGRLDDEATRRA